MSNTPGRGGTQAGWPPPGGTGRSTHAAMLGNGQKVPAQVPVHLAHKGMQVLIGPLRGCPPSHEPSPRACVYGLRLAEPAPPKRLATLYYEIWLHAGALCKRLPSPQIHPPPDAHSLALPLARPS